MSAEVVEKIEVIDDNSLVRSVNQEKKELKDFLQELQYIRPSTNGENGVDIISSISYPHFMKHDDDLERECGKEIDDLNESEFDLLEVKYREFENRWKDERQNFIRQNFPKIPFTNINYQRKLPFSRIRKIRRINYYTTFPMCCCCLAICIYVFIGCLLLLMSIFLSYTSDIGISMGLLTLLCIYPEIPLLLHILCCLVVCCPCLIHLLCWICELEPIIFSSTSAKTKLAWEVFLLFKYTVLCVFCWCLCLKYCPFIWEYYLICWKDFRLFCAPLDRLKGINQLAKNLNKFESFDHRDKIDVNHLDVEGTLPGIADQVDEV